MGSLIDPARIANDHIRIHALEGQLFRTVVQDAVVRNSLPCSIWRERDLDEVAAGVLNQSELRLRGTRDGPVFALVTVLVLAVAIVACYLPARGTTRIDPMAALRDG